MSSRETRKSQSQNVMAFSLFFFFFFAKDNKDGVFSHYNTNDTLIKGEGCWTEIYIEIMQIHSHMCLSMHTHAHPENAM